MIATARTGAAALLLIGAAACQGPGVSEAELPDEPIALLYHTEEEVRRRAESIEAAAEQRRPPAREPQAGERQGVVNVDDLRGYLRGMFGSAQVPESPELEGEPAEWAGRLALLDPRSGRVTAVDSARRGSVPADWSADHQRLLFTQLVRGRSQLFELDRASGEVRPITHGPAVHSGGCYGPDGRFVIATIDVARKDPAATIALTDPGGRNARSISQGPLDHSPACAPDGSAIAYVSVVSGGAERIVVRTPALTGKPRILAPGRAPAFSSDGQWIAYTAPVNRGWRLWRIRPDGTGRAPIGQGVLDEFHPSVSPDGRLVVYAAGDEFRRSLYLRRFDGSGDRLLLTHGDGERPVW